MPTNSRAPRTQRLAQSIALILCVSALPGLVAAQTAIRAGTPLQGQLDASSPKADDGTPYALYEYSGRAGDRIRVSQSSDDFDSFLAVGSNAAPGCSEDCKYDDDSGGELNARLNYTVPASGKVQIRVNSISSDASGDFTIEVAALPPPAPARAQALRLDTETRGSLSDSSARDDEERPYDLWTVSGRRNQEVMVRLNSDEFDAYVEFGRMERNQFVSSASDDDGGNGLNAKLRVSLDAQGRGAVKVTSIDGSAEGAYTLFVGEPPAQRPIVVQNIEVGGSVRGKLDEADSFDEEEIRFDVFKIEGRPGQRVVARLQSEGFDPVLKWGVLEGERLLQDAMDDDSGGGTSAQLSLTLDEDGIGRLIATSLDGSEGEYTLSIVGAPRPAQVER
jgi:hypothetical protein